MARLRKISILLSLALFCGAWNGCAVDSAGVGNGFDPDADGSEKLTGVTDSYWQYGAVIPVCFEKVDEGELASLDQTPRQKILEAIARDREAIQGFITDSWQQVVPLHFDGWGECPDSSSGLRIAFTDTCPDGTCSPHTKTLGRYLDSRKAGLVLPLAWSKHWRQKECRPGEWKRSFLGFLGPRKWYGNDGKHLQCMKEYAVHEFGHVIGFGHEHARADTPECSERESSDPTLVPYGPYDDKSVMNYCSTPRLGGGVLSDNDRKWGGLAYDCTHFAPDCQRDYALCKADPEAQPGCNDLLATCEECMKAAFPGFPAM